MRKIGQIALNTFRESVRDKVLYIIAFFAVMMMVGSLGLGWVSVGEELQIVQHFSLAVTSFFCALIAVFVGTGLIYKEIDKRTIYTILSKPVRRWEFLCGKFIGLVMVIACTSIGMGLVSAAATSYSVLTRNTQTVSWVDSVNWVLFGQAVLLIFFEQIIITALAIFFSSLSSPILAAIFTFCSYLIGQVSSTLIYMIEKFQPSTESIASQSGEHLSDAVSSTWWLIKPVSTFLYYVLPDLTCFQLRNRVVHGPLLRPGDISCLYLNGEFASAVLYALFYSAAVMLMAMLVFDRKKF